MICYLLADSSSYSDEQLQSLLSGFGKIAFIGVVFVVLMFLLLCVSVARRLGRRRERQLAEREAAPETESGDVWAESARRVEAESDETDDPDDDEDDSDLYGKDWEPGDDDDTPDDEPRW